MIYGALSDRAGVVVSEALLVLRRDRTRVDADPHRAAVFAGRLCEERDLLGDRARLLVVVEVARVVADLVDVRSDEGGELVALLEVY